MEHTVWAKRAHTEGMDAPHYLIGLISRFNNSFQAAADATFRTISWKQVFFLNCVVLFESAPTIREMADLLGCSHQNAKQILQRLENLGFARVEQDARDKRKQRIFLTEKAEAFRAQFQAPADSAMERLFSGIDAESLTAGIRVLTALCRNAETLKGDPL